MPIENTLIKDLSFPQSWRLIRAVHAYNRTVDKKFRIKTVNDLTGYFSEETLKSRLGVGPKTVQYFMEALNGGESC
jgi:hypothetical protein